MELDAGKFSDEDKEYIKKRGYKESDMFTFDHIDMMYVDHFSPEEAGEDCI